MDHQSPSQTTAKQKTKGKASGKSLQTDTNRATVHSTNPFKVAPVIAKGLSNTSRRALDEILREKLPGVKIDNIIYNQKAKIYTIQPSDIRSYQQLLDNFPKDSFPKDKNPSVYVPANIRQVIESESVCFMKNVDLDFEEDELRQALNSEGIMIKQLERLTRPGENLAHRKPTMTIKVICKDKKNRDTLLRTGLRISFCLFRCEPAKPNDIPLQCRRCNGYGHAMKYCRAESGICSRCGDKHQTVECQSSTTKCSNCGGNHEATSKQCSTFIEQQKKLRRTIVEYTTPTQVIPVITSQVDYPHLSSGSSKLCPCAHELLPSRFDAITEQLKVTNELVLTLTNTVSQLMQMQQAMLAAFAQQQPATVQMPFSFQLPPPSLTYRFPPPPPPHFSPDQTSRPNKQQKCNETTQQKRNIKPYDCAFPPVQTPNRRTRQTTKRQNSILLPSLPGTPADISRAPQTPTTATDSSMEPDQR